MIQVSFKPTFIRQFNALEEELQEEVVEKLELFKNIKNHKQLKVHKLKGRLAGRYSFSVNYQTRIVFIYEKKDAAVFLAVGSHDVYKK
ncbi:MAG: type II toxin-antitoxin system RelE/ParE family toxin [Patescibacteria group bacterium]